VGFFGTCGNSLLCGGDGVLGGYYSLEISFNSLELRYLHQSNLVPAFQLNHFPEL